MDTEQFDTPQKSKSSTTLANLWTQNGLKTSGGSGCGSPSNASKHHRKPLHPRTPNGSQSSVSTSCSSFHIFPNTVVNTPPAKRFHRVRNPFEAALAERLHLPLIASPSLFQRPATPQLSSTQFEWTIEDVSSLKPAHLEPHETQFQDSPDPDYEAKAQSAISSYFKDQQIVPSPVDCPLRNHRIILSEMNGNTPISKPGRRIRDCGTQTELSFPIVLPKALEEALKPYFQPQLSENGDNESTPCERGQRFNSYMSANSSSVGDCKDTSLRRKLFDMHNIIVLDGENKFSTANSSSSMPNSNSSPVAVVGTVQRTAIVGKLSDSMDKSSFGSLSPISATDGLSISPHSPSSAKRKSRLQNFLDLSESEALSPIHPPARAACSRRKSLKNSINAAISHDNYRSPANVSEQTFAELSTCDNEGKFTPDRSSSPLHSLENAEQSVDNSFNIKVSRLLVNSSKLSQANSSGRSKIIKKTNVDVDLFLHDDTDDMLDIDDEDMQVSQLSAHGSTCSSTSSSNTPRGKRRSASRKNLSQSFSINWLEDEGDDEAAPAVASNNAETESQLEFCSKQQEVLQIESASNAVEQGVVTTQISQEQRLLFYRTDSGFNEMTSSQSASNDEHSGEMQSQEQDVSMVCCSTPSKQTTGVAF